MLIFLFSKPKTWKVSKKTKSVELKHRSHIVIELIISKPEILLKTKSKTLI